MTELIYSEISYEIIGALFEVSNDLGSGYQEKIYQRAVAVVLERKGFSFREQVPVKVTFQGRIVGRYFLDFLIQDIIVLELKRGSYFSPQNIKQVVAYLKATNRQLGIIANFTSKGVRIKRLVNLINKGLSVYP